MRINLKFLWLVIIIILLGASLCYGADEWDKDIPLDADSKVDCPEN